MNLILATGNEHKAEEFQKLFSNSSLEIQAAPQKIEVIEDGLSFHENALKKAKAYFDHFQSPVVADDSGLKVESLPDELGIYSARFGGEGLSDKERALLLLEKLSGFKERKAQFICVLCFYLNPDEVFFFEGRMEGEISHEYSGEHGFGYDPVFIPTHYSGAQDLTIANLPEWKEKNSHRAKACHAAQKFFQGNDLS